MATVAEDFGGGDGEEAGGFGRAAAAGGDAGVGEVGEA